MRSRNRHSIFFQVSPREAFGKPRQILPDSRQHRPAFRQIRRHDPSLSPLAVLGKPLRRDLWKAGPLEKHSGPFSRIPAVRPASDGDFFFSCLIHAGRGGGERLLYPYRGPGGSCGKYAADSRSFADSLLFGLLCVVLFSTGFPQL